MGLPEPNQGTLLLRRPCPLCGETTGQPIGRLPYLVFDGSPISGDCILVVCRECGFAFNDTPSTQADYEKYYEIQAYYFTSKTAGTGGLGKYDAARFEDLFARVHPHIRSRAAAVFDVGCAKGGLLGTFSRNGYSNLYGVDMQTDCVEYARSAYGISADTGSVLELPFPDTRADAIILSHVVEHIIDLKQALSAVREKLSDDGILYVETPDASRYGEYSTNPYQDLYLEHVNHLDMATLETLLGENGFTPLQSGRCVLEASAVSHVPCVWAVFRKGKPEKRPKISLQQSLTRYVAWSATHPAYGNFSELTRTGRPIYLWGITQYAQLLLGQEALAERAVCGFIDMDPSKRSRTLNNRPVNGPDILLREERECSLIVTAPGYEEDIARSLTDYRFRGRAYTASGAELRYQY
ncbi:MAG: class I SAM-dependent methyltransferase [Deltaproteobacteria bacterium]|nr:class I SAM-dependent methyltransferase [Deltaproteobacteria bacterium]